MNKATTRLSKLMSVALRHNPASFGLQLDPEGWVEVEQLVAGLRTRPGWPAVTVEQVRHVVETSDKQRFELNGSLIRARYGHSRAARPTYRAVEPPPVLYHGTPRRNVEQILKDGLKAMSRQYVHLSATPAMARQVGRRRDEKPALLRIRAAEAHAAGIVFGTPSGQADNVYLVEAVPPVFIELCE